MKRLFIIILSFGCSLANASDLESNFEELKNTINKVQVLDEAKSGPNNIHYECQDCISEMELSESISIDKDEVILEKVMFSTGIKDNEFIIKRIKNGPSKVTIKFKDKYKKCRKTIAHKNPLSGQLGFSCLISTYELRDESIEVDFSDRTLEGDSEYIKVSLVKLARDHQGFINASFKDQSGRGITSEKSGKFLFFGTKYNLN